MDKKRFATTHLGSRKGATHDSVIPLCRTAFGWRDGSWFSFWRETGEPCGPRGGRLKHQPSLDIAWLDVATIRPRSPQRVEGGRAPEVAVEDGRHVEVAQFLAPYTARAEALAKRLQAMLVLPQLGARVHADDCQVRVEWPTSKTSATVRVSLAVPHGKRIDDVFVEEFPTLLGTHLGAEDWGHIVRVVGQMDHVGKVAVEWLKQNPAPPAVKL